MLNKKNLLGFKLKTLRKERGLSLQALSKKVGCSASYISMVENDKVDPSISRLKSLAAGLGYTIIDLFQNGINIFYKWIIFITPLL